MMVHFYLLYNLAKPLSKCPYYQFPHTLIIDLTKHFVSLKKKLNSNLNLDIILIVNVSIAQNTTDCPVINGATRCDLKGKNCRYINGAIKCDN